MTENQQVGLNKAASIKGMSVTQFWYYVRNNRGPEYEIVAGRKIFNSEAVKNWIPDRKRLGRPPKPTTEGNQND